MPLALAGLAATHAISSLVSACNRLSNPRSDLRGEKRKVAVEFCVGTIHNCFWPRLWPLAFWPRLSPLASSLAFGLWPLAFWPLAT